MTRQSRVGMRICLAFCVVIRLLWIGVVSPAHQQQLMTGGDNEYYRSLAMNLLAGKGYSVQLPGAPTPQPTAKTVPGMSFYIASVFAMTGADIQHVRLVNVALEMITTLVIMLLVLRVTGCPRRMLAAGWLYALWPVAILFAGDWSTICLATCSVAVITALHIGVGERRFGALAVGLAVGLGVLVRPAALVMPLALVWWPESIARSRVAQVRYVLLAYVGVGLALTPWLIRNAVVMGSPVLASQSSWVFYRGWTGEGLTDRATNASSLPYRPDQEIAMQPVYLRAGLDEIRQHPGKSLRLAVEKVFRLWLHMFMRAGRVISAPPLTLLLAMALSLLALGAWRGGLPVAYWRMVGVAAVLNTLLHVATYAMSPYSLPFYPMLMPGMVGGLFVLARALRRSDAPAQVAAG